MGSFPAKKRHNLIYIRKRSIQSAVTEIVTGPSGTLE